mmetsp:Transcript_48465/g.135396  ORF Transcript_48465/g.135396 Transcript_48465/m.135396 type:complete len:554 (-) Transcript_48465:43-1704(-)
MHARPQEGFRWWRSLQVVHVLRPPSGDQCGRPCQSRRPWGPPRRTIVAGAMVAALVGTGNAGGSSESDNLTVTACRRGQIQLDPIALGCAGGSGRKQMWLTEAGTSQRYFVWRAPAGTWDLQATASLQLQPLTSGVALSGRRTNVSIEPSFSLTVQCMDSDRILIGTSQGLLNSSVRSAVLNGAKWSWSGDPVGADARGFYIDGFRIDGTLTCDVEVILENKHELPIMGEIGYSWGGISPCLDILLGCVPCPSDVCHNDEEAMCDGTPYWFCVPKVELSTTSFASMLSTAENFVTSTIFPHANAELMRPLHPQLSAQNVLDGNASTEVKQMVLDGARNSSEASPNLGAEKISNANASLNFTEGERGGNLTSMARPRDQESLPSTSTAVPISSSSRSFTISTSFLPTSSASDGASVTTTSGVILPNSSSLALDPHAVPAPAGKAHGDGSELVTSIKGSVSDADASRQHPSNERPSLTSMARALLVGAAALAAAVAVGGITGVIALHQELGPPQRSTQHSAHGRLSPISEETGVNSSRGGAYELLSTGGSGGGFG